MEFIKKYQLVFIGIIVGAIAGFFYWQQIGCNSGTCAITSSPFNSTMYGALMGALFANIFQKEEKKEIE
jgi:uncharacterized membrane protein